MPSRVRVSGAVLVACGLALLACSSGAPAATTCSTAAECPSDARCISSTCVRNAAPSLALELPADAQTNVLVSFDASGSADPDAGDSIDSFAWRFRALSGQTCAVPVVAGAGAIAIVRFGCPGRYAVDVTATDEMGASARITKELDVAAHAAPLLVVGDDVSLDHLCTSEAACAAGPASLSASTPGIDQVSFSWTVEPPPDRPLSAARRVTFTPGPDAAAPQIEIVTDGIAISGDWVFHVEARDAAGVIGTAEMRVSVGNRLPELSKTIPVPAHLFDGSRFTSDGEIPYAVSDPDGDPLVGVALASHHTGDGDGTFDATLSSDPTRVTFSISVPYSVPADAAYLIGGAGLERTLVLEVVDVNGGRTTESWPIVVGNEPPTLVFAPAHFAIDHTFDGTAQAYVADVPLSTWSDPDGDPLWQVPDSATGDLVCPEFAVVDGVARTSCRLAFAGTPAVGNFSREYTITQAVQDPWSPANVTSTVAFAIGNRAPSITSTATHVDGLCSGSGTCCYYTDGLCDARWSTVSGITTVPSRWTDPDGDPISVIVTGSGNYTPVQPLVCTPPGCALDVDVAPMQVCLSSDLVNLATTVTDGLGSASGVLPIQATCYTP